MERMNLFQALLMMATLFSAMVWPVWIPVFAAGVYACYVAYSTGAWWWWGPGLLSAGWSAWILYCKIEDGWRYVK